MTFKRQKHSEEWKQEHSKRMKGNQTASWKGDDAGYSAIHKWVHRNKPRPEKCVKCNKRPPREVACINGIYDRNINNYSWLCNKCHWKYDHSKQDTLYIIGRGELQSQLISCFGCKTKQNISEMISIGTRQCLCKSCFADLQRKIGNNVI